jgi:hypothetical protein
MSLLSLFSFLKPTQATQFPIVRFQKRTAYFLLIVAFLKKLLRYF